MRSSWMCASSSLRKRWKSVVVLTLLVGFIGAVVLTAFAGSRRTETSFDRFRQETHESDLTLFVPAADATSLAHLRALPGVASIGRFRAMVVTINGQVAAFGGPVDPGLTKTVDRPRVLEGRHPREDRADEIALPEVFTTAHGIHLGDTVIIHGYTQAQVNQIAGESGHEADWAEGAAACRRDHACAERSLDPGNARRFGAHHPCLRARARSPDRRLRAVRAAGSTVRPEGGDGLREGSARAARAEGAIGRVPGAADVGDRGRCAAVDRRARDGTARRGRPPRWWDWSSRDGAAAVHRRWERRPRGAPWARCLAVRSDARRRVATCTRCGGGACCRSCSPGVHHC